MGDDEKEWVLPALIPFKELKGKDLEECLYWLLDAMGAKDLEWRTGGSGGGAADGGRDLEAHFYVPTADNEMEPQVWWVECKGRTGTVEPDDVKSAAINAQARSDLDYVVVATNTQFSNPTRDWMREWQKTHPRPKVKLWDSGHLERLLSRHPDVVLRLFSEALSLQGQFQALESRFWNKLEFVSSPTLAKMWKSRDDAGFTAMGSFALIANEFANGNIIQRPWGAVLGSHSLLEVLHIGLVNTPYLMMRALKGGVDQSPITRAFAYLILCALDKLSSESIAELIIDSITRGKRGDMPENVQAMLLMPIMDQLLSEIQDVCSSDCRRMMSLNRRALTEDKDEIEDYWLRLEAAGLDEPEEPTRYLRIERNDAPCEVGFKVDKDNGCPLFAIEPTVQNFAEALAVIKRVAAFRKKQAEDKRDADALKLARGK